MSARGTLPRPVDAGKRVLAISAEQIEAIAAPGSASWLWLETPTPVPPVIGRPYFVWKDDLDIARRLNDYFARDVDY